MSSAYQLKPWSHVVIPHKDIRDGKLDSSVYAASLGAVVRNDPQCPPVYRDAREFFTATYLTEELRKLLDIVLSGLCGEGGDRVLQLRTPFGGGKTHSLLSLYHIAKNRDAINNIDDPALKKSLSTLKNPGTVDVVAFIGLDVDASTGVQIPGGPRILTPWGYLAWKVGGQETYDLVAQQDQQKVAPGNDIIRQILGDRTVLILMDELLVYVENAMGIRVEDSTLGRQVLTFMQKLTEVVRDLPKTVLVYSLQASVQEAVGSEGLLDILDKLVSRIDAKKEPVSGDEVMKVIQRRLFESVGDAAVIDEIAREQAKLFLKFRESYEDTNRGKQEVQQQADLLAERIRSSYPFHPDLLDLMYHRWGSLPSYQRTRGALQFLARVVYALKDQNTSLLIGPGDVPLDDEGTRGAFFSQVGEREAYRTVVDADLIGRKARVKVIDNRIAQDSPALSHLKVGSRLAAAIMLYSFGARTGEDRGVVEQEITAACLAPGLDRNTIAATLSDLREQLLYLHYTSRRYRFETKPNLNKLIADEETKIDGNDVLENLKTALGKTLTGGQGKPILWPSNSMAVTDHVPQFSIVYLPPEWAEKSRDAVLTDVLEWIEHRGNDKREYKNAIAFVIPNKVQMDKARKAGRTVAAVTSLLTQKSKYAFSPEDLDELATKSKESAQDITAALRRLYDYVLLPLPDTGGNAPIRLEPIDLQSQINTSQNLQDRVLDALKTHVFDSITPSKLVRLSGIEDSETGYITGDALTSYFFRFPTFPKMLDIQPIKTGIIKAVQSGLIGYVPYMTILPSGEPKVENPALVFFERTIPMDELDLSGYLLAPSWVKQFLPDPEENTEHISGSSTDSGDPVTTDYTSDGSDSSSNTSTSRSHETKATVEFSSTTSSIERTVTVDVIDGKKTAQHYKLSAIVDKAKFFQLFTVIQSLSDKADDMSIQIEIRAHTQDQFDPTWISGAIEEPLDELDIKASTRLE